MNGNSFANNNMGFMNAAGMQSGGGFLGTYQPGSMVSALSIPPAMGPNVFAGSSVPGVLPNLGAVVIPNSPGEGPSSVTPGVIPEFGGGGFQVVQSIPSMMSADSSSFAGGSGTGSNGFAGGAGNTAGGSGTGSGNTAGGSGSGTGNSAGGSGTGSSSFAADSFVAEGSYAAASIKQSTRFVRFTNASDKKATFFIQYETIDTEGRAIWMPPLEDGVRYAAAVEVAAGQSVDVKEGDWRVNASRARIWATGEDREWSRYRKIDLWLVPEVDEDGNHSYRAPDPEIYSYTIG